MVRGGVYVHFLPFGAIAVMSGIGKETDDRVEGVKNCLEGGAVHGIARMQMVAQRIAETVC
jgi:hypothetical protein